MKWRQTGPLLDCTVPFGFGATLCLTAPLSTALQFGGDEGYELMKGYLVSRHHPLYFEIWNDQPPLHTELLAFLFQIFGPSAYIGRLISVAFAMLLVASLYHIVRNTSGRIAGLVALVLLLSSSMFLQLSVSVMIEMPAMALALAAVWTCSNPSSIKRWEQVALSGLLFGCALQVKFTAAIFAPALAANYLIGQRCHGPDLPRRITFGCLSKAAIWCGGVFAVCGIVLVMFYDLDAFSVFWHSHFAGANLACMSSERLGFHPIVLLDDPSLVVSAPVGAVLILSKRRSDLLFPIVLMVTVISIHSWHRPYWNYYGLHFAIPMAWLGAVGMVDWFRLLWMQSIGNSLVAKLRLSVQWLGLTILVSLSLALAAECGWNNFRHMLEASPASEDLRVRKLRQNAAQVTWIFTDSVIYAFWAGLLVPPELAVIPSKRIWSCQINGVEVRRCLDRYRPEMILLSTDWASRFGLTEYLKRDYRSSSEDGIPELYIRR